MTMVRFSCGGQQGHQIAADRSSRAVAFPIISALFCDFHERAPSAISLGYFSPGEFYKPFYACTLRGTFVNAQTEIGLCTFPVVRGLMSEEAFETTAGPALLT